MHTPDTEKIIRRTQGYWYEDGIAETATGVLFVLVGLMFLVEATAPPRSPLAGLSAIGLPVLLVVGMLAGRIAVRALKERLTYPRTGYVAYRRPGARHRSATFALAAAVGAVVAVLFQSTPASLAWLPALDGIAIGVFLLFLGYKLGLARFYALALASVVLGGLGSLAGRGDVWGTGIYFATMGAATIVSGSLTLAAYLSGTRPSVED